MRHLLVGLLGIAGLLGAPPVAAEERPDLIVIMVDDLGAIDNRLLNRLPNIRSLFIDNGLSFTSYYNETPLCCPGRATFLTGQHTRRHGVNRNRASLLNPANTIATALHDAGYQTAQIGKYLNNLGSIDKTPPGWDRNVMYDDPSSPDPSTFYVNGVAQTRGYMDRVILDESVAWVTQAGPAPLFLWTNPRAPHWGSSQSQPSKPYIEPRYQGPGGSQCNGIPLWSHAGYSYAKQPKGWPLGAICRSLLTVDEMVGDLRDAMAARGRPTIYVFTSDNGMAWGWHGFPLKNVPESGRTPLYFAGNGVPTGQSNALLSNIDLGPTLAQLGGTTMPQADGVPFSFDTAGHDWILEDHPLGGYTAGPWRSSWWAVRTPEWHLVRRSGRNYLYHLTADPWENQDVAAANPDVVSDLAQHGP